MAGLLAVQRSTTAGRPELLWAHSTSTMCLAFASGASTGGKFIFSQLPPGQTLLVQAMPM